MGDPLLIDEYLQQYDVEICEHVLVDADPETTWRAARDLDLLTIHTPLLDAAMWARGLPARLAGRSPDVPPRLTFGGEDGGLPGWLELGHTPGRELLLGAVGKFWQPDIEWRDVPHDKFAGFAEPGWGKIAAGFTTLAYGDRTLLTYICRTATTDEASAHQFDRYWWVIRPFVAHIMRATVRAVKEAAEAAALRSPA